MTFRGTYPPDWPAIAQRVKREADGRCIRCGHAHDPEVGRTLTVHHLDNDKSNVRWWNLVALCQACHLAIQGKVKMGQAYLYPHSAWFMPYVAGLYAFTVLGEDLSRSDVARGRRGQVGRAAPAPLARRRARAAGAHVRPGAGPVRPLQLAEVARRMPDRVRAREAMERKRRPEG